MYTVTTVCNNTPLYTRSIIAILSTLSSIFERRRDEFKHDIQYRNLEVVNFYCCGPVQVYRVRLFQTTMQLLNCSDDFRKLLFVFVVSLSK